METNWEEELEQAQELIDYQQNVIKLQADRIGHAIDMIEELAQEDSLEHNLSTLEDIIEVLQYGK